MIKAGEGTFIPEDINCYPEVDLSFGKYCSIGSGLKIYSGTHACIEYPEVVSTFAFAEVKHWTYPKGKTGGFVKIGSDVWIATDVKILEGVTIGDGAIIGAGSVVTRDVEPYVFVAGNPAIWKSFRFNPKQVEKLLKIKWWNWPEEEIKEAIIDMNNIETFLKKYGEL